MTTEVARPMIVMPRLGWRMDPGGRIINMSSMESMIVMPGSGWRMGPGG